MPASDVLIRAKEVSWTLYSAFYHLNAIGKYSFHDEIVSLFLFPVAEKCIMSLGGSSIPRLEESKEEGFIRTMMMWLQVGVEFVFFSYYLLLFYNYICLTMISVVIYAQNNKWIK